MKRRLAPLRSAIIRPLPLSLVILFAASVLLTYKLTSLISFINIEAPHTLGSATIGEIRGNILYAPLKSLQFALLKLTENDAWIRLGSVAAALAAAYFLYALLKKWHTTRVAILTSAMFVTSSWFLHNGRMTGGDILFLPVMPAMILVFLWMLSKQNQHKLPLASVLLGLLLYIPGTWIILLAGLIMYRKALLRLVQSLSRRSKVINGSLFILTIAPLIYSFTYRQRQIIEWLGYNNASKISPGEILQNFIDIPRHLLLSGPGDPLYWLAGTPIFDIFSVAMMILGIYAYRAGYYPAREKLVFGACLLAVLLIGLGDVVGLGLLIPLLYILIANGLAYLLQSWFTVFPRNPVARTAGIVLLSAVVALSCFYNLQRYFVAWPKSEATKSAIEAAR